jgi:hypothetical protein
MSIITVKDGIAVWDRQKCGGVKSGTKLLLKGGKKLWKHPAYLRKGETLQNIKLNHLL